MWVAVGGGGWKYDGECLCVCWGQYVPQSSQPATEYYARRITCETLDGVQISLTPDQFDSMFSCSGYCYEDQQMKQLLPLLYVIEQHFD